MISIFFKYYSIFLLLVTITWLTGYLLFRIIAGKHIRLSNIYSLSFVSFLSGIIFWVFIYSVFKTGFSTINLSMLIIAAGFLYLMKKKPVIEKENISSFSFKPLLFLLLASTLLFIINSTFVLRSGDVPFVLVDAFDNTCYARISEALNYTGVENRFTFETLLSAEMFGYTNPYRYFHLWTNAMICGIFKLNYFLGLNLVVQSYFLFLGLSGMLALIRTYFKINAFSFIIAYILLNVGMLYFGFYNNFKYLSLENYRLENFDTTPYLPPHSKLSVIFPFAILSVLLYIKKEYKFLLLSILVLPLLAISSLPLSGLLIGFSFLLILWKKELKEYTPVLIVSLSFFIFYFLFYKFTSSNTEDVTGNVSTFSSGLFTLASLKTSANIFFLTTFQMVVIYFPILLLPFYLYLREKESRKTIMFFLRPIALIYFCCLFSWAVMHLHQDGIQLFSNNIILLNILFAAMFVSLYSVIRKHKIILILLSGILLFRLYMSLDWCILTKSDFRTMYSDEFIKAYVAKTTGDDIIPDQRVGVFIRAKEDYVSAADVGNPSHYLGPFLYYSDKYFADVNISVFDQPIFGDTLGKLRIDYFMKNKQFFARYVDIKKQKGNFASVAQCQYDFIKEYGIEFIILSAHALLPENIRPVVNDSIKDGDGVKIYFIKK